MEGGHSWFGGTKQGSAEHVRSPSGGRDFGLEQVSKGLASWLASFSPLQGSFFYLLRNLLFLIHFGGTIVGSKSTF